MNFGRVCGGLSIVLLVVCSVFAQHLRMKRSGNIVQVARGKKILYRVALRGKKNERGRKYDEAFLAGSCLIVRRNVRQIETGTESYPDVSRLEIYQSSGEKRVYHEARLPISRINDWDLINSPDYRWAIIPDNGESMFDGYFYVSPQCEIRQVTFDREDRFDWGDRSDASFIDAATLKFSSIVNRPEGEKIKKVNVFITEDGNFRVERIDN